MTSAQFQRPGGWASEPDGWRSGMASSTGGMMFAIAMRWRRMATRLVAVALTMVWAVVWMVAAGGCTVERLNPVETIMSPHDRPQLWAIAPLMNESGVSVVDIGRLSDLLGEELQRVVGIDTLPLNRVIAAMRESGIDRVTTAGDVRQLMNVLEVDGMVIGTITAYDPYRPLKLGMALQLFSRDATEGYDAFDPRELTWTGTGEVSPGGMSGSRATAAAAGIFDTTHHDTIARLEAYAVSRAEPDSAFGTGIYLVQMELFAQFVSDQLIRALLESERTRVVLVTEDTAKR